MHVVDHVSLWVVGVLPTLKNVPSKLVSVEHVEIDAPLVVSEEAFSIIARREFVIVNATAVDGVYLANQCHNAAVNLIFPCRLDLPNFRKVNLAISSELERVSIGRKLAVRSWLADFQCGVQGSADRH